jgi:hypothetical protein
MAKTSFFGGFLSMNAKTYVVLCMMLGSMSGIYGAALPVAELKSTAEQQKAIDAGVDFLIAQARQNNPGALQGLQASLQLAVGLPLYGKIAQALHDIEEGRGRVPVVSNFPPGYALVGQDRSVRYFAPPAVAQAMAEDRQKMLFAERLRIFRRFLNHPLIQLGIASMVAERINRYVNGLPMNPKAKVGAQAAVYAAFIGYLAYVYYKRS